jgi:hypothetical protein
MRPGRPKGARNKLTANVKENIIAVFTKLGGTAAMAKWAGENLTEYYKIYARLAPTQVEVDVEHRDVTALSDAELAAIATGSSPNAADAPGGEAEPTPIH